jgi:hypothetical protein
LKELNFETLASPDVVSWFRIENLKYFPTLVFPTPPPIKVVVTQEEETSFPSNRIPSSSKTQMLPLSPKFQDAFVSFKAPSPPPYPAAHNPMVGANIPRNRMDDIVAARYAPLILPHLVNALPVGEYLKYMPKFTGEEDITAEEHLAAIYSYAGNISIDNEDVWMRLFVHSLDGEARKWFRGLTLGSIVGIEALDDVFLRHWGNKKDYLYYIIEFGSLKRKEAEYVSDFSKIFNRIYNKIPTEIKPK